MTEIASPRGVTLTLYYWSLLERWVAVVAFSLIGALIFADVAGREFVGPVGRFLGLDLGATGVYGARKMALFLLVIGAFSGLGVSVAAGAQIVPRIAFKWVPKSWNDSVNRLSNLLSALVLFAVTYYGTVFVLSSREIGTIMPGIDTPVWVIQSAIPIGFASAAMRYLIFAIWPSTAPAHEEIPE